MMAYPKYNWLALMYLALFFESGHSLNIFDYINYHVLCNAHATYGLDRFMSLPRHRSGSLSKELLIFQNFEIQNTRFN
jgi:hypothetical protein